MKKSVISGLITIAILIAYAAIVIHGIHAMQDWAWSGHALIPLGIICGVGCAVSNTYWDKEKKNKK